MRYLACCCVFFAALLVASASGANAAPPSSCVNKFVGTWTVTVLATGQTYRSQIRADGTLTSFCPLCPPSQSWTCNGNTFILTSPVSLTQTLSADGRRMGGGCCSATRVGGAPAVAKQAPPKKEAPAEKKDVAAAKQPEAPPQPPKSAQPGESGARPDQPPPAAAAPPPLENYLIFFDRSRAEVGDFAQKIIDEVAKGYWSAAAKGIDIVGHADSEPVEGKNAGLAQARADAVRAALIGTGVPAAAVTAAAVGSSQPLVKAADGGPEPQNRRVEISLRLPTANDFLIFFDRSSAEMTPAALDVADLIAQQFKSTGAKGVRIVGHIDPEPVEAANAVLARTRGEAVRAALLAKGIPEAVIVMVAAGSSRPMAPPSAEPEPVNRRVEIALE
jgi:outer membrane protein OmpA-like peptidoglycan-associated protein